MRNDFIVIQLTPRRWIVCQRESDTQYRVVSYPLKSRTDAYTVRDEFEHKNASEYSDLTMSVDID
jgi:hypothetical protein